MCNAFLEWLSGAMNGVSFRTPTWLARLIGRVGFMVLGVLVAGFLCEGLARWFFPHWAPRTGALTSFWQHDSLLGWSHIPNSTGSFNSFGFDSSVVINSKGFRDRERSYVRGSKDKYRMVVLGDSMVWGWGVQQNEIFTALVEKECREIEVINLGVSGYGTDQELLLLRQEALRYRPDLIVLVIMDNDFETNVRKSLFLGYQKPMFESPGKDKLVLTNTPVPKQSIWFRLAAWTVSHSYFLNQAARTYERFALKVHFPNGEITSPPAQRAPFPRSSAENLTVALLLEIQRETEMAGANLLFILADRMGKWGEEIESYFKLRHIHVLNLDPTFPLDESQTLHLPDRVHWNVRGHQKVAGSLLAYLRNGSLSANSCPTLPSRFLVRSDHEDPCSAAQGMCNP